MDARTYPAKATPKSLRTRARILDAAMRLFAEVGYHAATNAVIADAAKLTRGAMLYHFATREELVEAAVAHIELERARAVRAGGRRARPRPASTPPSTPSTPTGRCCTRPPFVAFAELEAAARTDADAARPAGRGAGAPSTAPRWATGSAALAQAGADPRFQTSRDLGRFLLEGLARGAMTYDETARRERLLAVVKRAVRMLNRKGDVHDLWTE